MLWGALPLEAQDEGGERRTEYIIEHVLGGDGSAGAAQDAVLAADGRYLAAVDARGTIRVWESESGTLRRQIATGTHAAARIRFFPEREQLLSGGSDGSLVVWSLDSTRSVQRISGHQAAVMALTLGARGGRAYSADAQGLLIAWNLRTGTHHYRLQAHQGEVRGLALHPEQQVLASVGVDRTLALWDAQSGQLLTRLKGPLGSLNAVAFSADGSLLAAASADGTVTLWRWSYERVDPYTILSGHERSVWRIAFHPNSQWLFSSAVDGSIKLWDVTQNLELGRPQPLEEAPATAMALDARGERFLVAFANGPIYSWRLGPSALIGAFDLAGTAVRALDFSPARQHLLAATADGNLHLWQIPSRELLQTLEPPENPDWRVVRFDAALNPSSNPSQNTPQNASQNAVLSGDADGRIVAWDLAARQERWRIQAHRGAVSALAVHPSRASFLSAGADGSWASWQRADGQLLRRQQAHQGAITALAFHPNGAIFASAGSEGQLQLWQQDGGPLYAVQAHPTAIQAVQFGPLGEVLASGGADRLIRIWQAEDGQLRHTLAGHTAAVTGLAFIDGGTRLISIAEDRTVRLWDLRRGRLIRNLSGESHALHALALSQREGVMVVASTAPALLLLRYGRGRRSTEGRVPLAAEAAGDAAPPAGEVSPARALQVALKRELDALLRQGGFCSSGGQLVAAADQVLAADPADRAAYQALAWAAVARRDFKMVYLMTRIGLAMPFDAVVYRYASSEESWQQLNRWQRQVFAGEQARVARKPLLTYRDCQQRERSENLPDALLRLDIPQQTLTLLREARLTVRWSDFQDIPLQRFLARLDLLASRSAELARLDPPERPWELVVDDAEVEAFGDLDLDLTEVDSFGEAGAVPFQLRRGREAWRTYLSDADRRKRLLLPRGDYYLRVEGELRQAFTVREGEVSAFAIRPR